MASQELGVGASISLSGEAHDLFCFPVMFEVIISLNPFGRLSLVKCSATPIIIIKIIHRPHTLWATSLVGMFPLISEEAWWAGCLFISCKTIGHRKLARTLSPSK